MFVCSLGMVPISCWTAWSVTTGLQFGSAWSEQMQLLWLKLRPDVYETLIIVSSVAFNLPLCQGPCVRNQWWEFASPWRDGIFCLRHYQNILTAWNRTAYPTWLLQTAKWRKALRNVNRQRMRRWGRHQPFAVMMRPLQTVMGQFLANWLLPWRKHAAMPSKLSPKDLWLPCIPARSWPLLRFWVWKNCQQTFAAQKIYFEGTK